MSEYPPEIQISRVNIEATATSFLLRYYLHNTPLTTHPKYLILTTLFLASKTENAFIPLEYFKQQLPASVDASQLTSLEFPLSSGLQFSYTVWSCLRPLWGFGLELIELVNEGALDFEKDIVRRVLDDARQWGSESLRTDAQFLFTPPQIALACLYHFNGQLIRVFLAIKFPPGRVLAAKSVGETVRFELEGGREDAAERLLKTVVECEGLIAQRLDVIKDRSKEYVTGIDKKLYQCKKLLDSQSTESSPPSDSAKRKSDVSDDNTRPPKKAKAD